MLCGSFDATACQSGVWRGTSGSGSYVAAYSVSGSTGWQANSSGSTQIVTAFNQNSVDDDCYVTGAVNTIGTVAAMVDNNQTGAKICGITFAVPSGTSYEVLSTPYASSQNDLTVFVYQE